MFLTIFTPTYNRSHTLTRLYESLCQQTCTDFEWLVVDDGSTDGTQALINGFIAEAKFPVRYHYKENGGLYTGYNAAYALAAGELAMCIDSDDYAPANAVELVKKRWNSRPAGEFSGVLGLDFYAGTDTPIGGYFPPDMDTCFFYDLQLHGIHRGDTKEALRLDLVRPHLPLTGFDNERYLNPVYLIWQATENHPMLVVNNNLCHVDYNQTDSMSATIFHQYLDSPRSFAKLRIYELNMPRNTWLNRLRCYLHLASHCHIARDYSFSSQVPSPLLFWLLSPFGPLLSLYIHIRSNYSPNRHLL